MSDKNHATFASSNIIEIFSLYAALHFKKKRLLAISVQGVKIVLL